MTEQIMYFFLAIASWKVWVSPDLSKWWAGSAEPAEDFNWRGKLGGWDQMQWTTGRWWRWRKRNVCWRWFRQLLYWYRWFILILRVQDPDSRPYSKHTTYQWAGQSLYCSGKLSSGVGNCEMHALTENHNQTWGQILQYLYLVIFKYFRKVIVFVFVFYVFRKLSICICNWNTLAKQVFRVV